MKIKNSTLALILAGTSLLTACNSGSSNNSASTLANNSAHNTVNNTVASEPIYSSGLIQLKNLPSCAYANIGYSVEFNNTVHEAITLVNKCESALSLDNTALSFVSQRLDRNKNYIFNQVDIDQNDSELPVNVIGDSTRRTEYITFPAGTTIQGGGTTANLVVLTDKFGSGYDFDTQITTFNSVDMHDAYAIDLSDAPVNTYTWRDSFENVTTPSYGLKTVMVTNNTNDTIKNVKLNTSSLPKDVTVDTSGKATCTNDGSQTLAKDSSCIYVLRYTPAEKGESGTFDVKVNAQHTNGLAYESAMNIKYSSH